MKTRTSCKFSKKAENVSLFLGHYIIKTSIFSFSVSDIKILILCVQEKNGCNTEDNGRSAKC